MRWLEKLAVLMVPLAVSCSHAKPPVATEAPSAPAAAAESTAQKPDASAAAEPARQCKADSDCPQDQLCVASSCRRIVAGMPECANATAHFDFDRATLQDADAPTLRRLARCLQAIPAGKAVVAGNCDDRGTSQYNVALGFRRAASVESYLANLGVARDRVETVSYGEERPLCSESSEECWAKNRRADIAAP